MDLPKTQDALPAESGEHQRVEEALRASEQRLQDILDNSTAVVSVKDLELRYILVNREYERRFQVQRDEIRGKTDYDVLPRDLATGMAIPNWMGVPASMTCRSFARTVSAISRGRTS